MQKETIVKDFKIHLERLGYGSGTLKMLPMLIDDFLCFTGKEIYDIESGDIITFYEHLKERPHKRKPGGLSESYINHHVYSLKVFFNWQLEKGALQFNPISALEFPRPKSKPREILTIEEIKEVYQVTETLREKALLSIYYGCGLRRSEGVALDLSLIHI
jgi:integrase/recombinase XerD